MCMVRTLYMINQAVKMQNGNWKKVYLDAVAELGGKRRTAIKLGRSRQPIYNVLTADQISAELVRDIAKLSEIDDVKHKLRPDLWEPGQ